MSTLTEFDTSLLRRIALDARGLVQDNGDCVRIGASGWRDHDAVAARVAIAHLVGAGYLAIAGSGQWRVTEAGEDLVDSLQG